MQGRSSPTLSCCCRVGCGCEACNTKGLRVSRGAIAKADRTYMAKGAIKHSPRRAAAGWAAAATRAKSPSRRRLRAAERSRTSGKPPAETARTAGTWRSRPPAHPPPAPCEVTVLTSQMSHVRWPVEQLLKVGGCSSVLLTRPSALNQLDKVVWTNVPPSEHPWIHVVADLKLPRQLPGSRAP